MSFDPDFLARLRRSVAVSAAQTSSDFDLNQGGFGTKRGTPLTPAGVLVGLRLQDGHPLVTLTKRTSALKHHPGQIAFPGGKQEAGDADIAATALREAEEEIGLRAEAVTVLGALGPHETVTGFQATPVLGLIGPDFRPEPDHGEVADVFDVPFAFLMDPDNTRVESRIWHGQRRYYYVIPYGPYYIWGATARMLVGLRSAWENAA